MASQIAEIAIRKSIALKADDYYEQAKNLGEIAYRGFGENKKSQIRSLESIANSALVVADILDFIKRQTGRSAADKQWRLEDFGRKLLKDIDESLRKNAQEIADDITKSITDHQMTDADQRRIHVLLSREFIRHLSAHYLYSMSLPEELRRLSEQATANEEPVDLQGV
jgi:hypothetical protein